MTPNAAIDVYLKRYPRLAASLYALVLVALSLTALVALVRIGEQYRALNASAENLARLERRAASASSESDWVTGPIPPGSPFLDGLSVTVASAALLERVTAAITHAGGMVVSSEVAQQGEQPNRGFVKVMATCELQEEALEQLLYDLEGGMPFLFVDQLTAEASTSSGGPMRITLGVSGLWSGATK